MQLDAKTFLRLCEIAKTICFFDIESTGLNGDYNSILTISIRPFDSSPRFKSVTQAGDDRALVAWARDELAKFDCWVSYYGKGFDVPMIQSRLLVNRLKPLVKKHHVDMYFHMNAHLNTSRRSQAHRLRWLNVDQQKMSLSPSEWNLVLRNPKRGLRVMERRCNSDTAGLQGLYKRFKGLIGEVTR